MDTEGLVTDGLENWVSPPKKSPKKPINRMCLGEESTDEATQSGISISITESKVDGDGVEARVVMST